MLLCFLGWFVTEIRHSVSIEGLALGKKAKKAEKTKQRKTVKKVTKAITLKREDTEDAGVGEWSAFVSASPVFLADASTANASEDGSQQGEAEPVAPQEEAAPANANPSECCVFCRSPPTS